MTNLLSGRHKYLTNKNTKKGQKVRKIIALSALKNGYCRVQILLPQPYSEAKKDIMASNPRNLTISGVFLAFARFFAIMRFADTECRKKDIISKKRLPAGFEPCSTRF